ncbi:hypothetical protein ACTWPT_46025 [Nonomuraea sp. 3N208]|uniref:hypothetical protein n=1 Tax=Nonomuraea sp. 3N208 TaxID=3457421 RepID=UPI003FD1872D
MLKKILLLLGNPEAGYPLGGGTDRIPASWWSAATPGVSNGYCGIGGTGVACTVGLISGEA